MWPNLISSPTSSTPLLPACFLNHETRKTIIRVMTTPELYHARIPSFRVFASYLQYCLRHPRSSKKKIRQAKWMREKKNWTSARLISTRETQCMVWRLISLRFSIYLVSQYTDTHLSVFSCLTLPLTINNKKTECSVFDTTLYSL